MSGKELSKKRRTNLPLETTIILRNWLKNHIHNPYPSEALKIHIARETNLTILQVSNWFINARRRYLPQLLEDYRKRKASDSLPKKDGFSFEDSPTDENNNPNSKRQKTLQKSSHLTSQNDSTYTGSSQTSEFDYECNLKLLSSVACLDLRNKRNLVLRDGN